MPDATRRLIEEVERFLEAITWSSELDDIAEGAQRVRDALREWKESQRSKRQETD